MRCGWGGDVFYQRRRPIQPAGAVDQDGDAGFSLACDVTVRCVESLQTHPRANQFSPN